MAGVPQPPLPTDVAGVLARLRIDRDPRLPAALRDAHTQGWTLANLAGPVGLTGERVRQIIQIAGDEASEIDIPPAPPPPTLTADEVATLRELYRAARTVNGRTPAGDPRRRQSEQLSRMLAHVWLDRGINPVQIQRQTGIGWRGIRARMVRHGYVRPGGARPPAARGRGQRLTAADVAAARRAAADGTCLSAIARDLGVHHETIAKAVYGVNWRTITDPPALPRPRVARRARRRGRLTEQQVASARREYAAGATKRTLAARYRVGEDTIREAIHGVTWTHVQDPPPVPRGRRPSSRTGETQ